MKIHAKIDPKSEHKIDLWAIRGPTFEVLGEFLKMSCSILFTCVHLFFIVLLLLGRRVGRSPLNPPPPFGVQGVLDALSDSCQFLSDSKSLLWPPPCPPTLPKVAGLFALGRPKPPTLSILSRLFADRKLIKNQTPQKPSQNLKSRTPDRPKVDFVFTFGINFGMDFHEILDFFIIC